MALPTILFNNGTGSDSAASGAGPSTALTGTAASYSGSVVTLDGSPNLSGVDATGLHALYLVTSSGRKFFAITAVDNSAKTVTVGNAPAGTATGLSWAIGGKRKTIGDTNSRLLFSADAKPGWAIQLEDDQPALTSAVACSAAGDATGCITLKGDSTSTRRLLTSATNNTSLLSGGLTYWKILNLKLTSTAATKTSSYGVDFNASSSGIVQFQNCVFGDPTDKLQKGINRTGSSQGFVRLVNCEVQYCLGLGLDNGGGGTSLFALLDCKVHHNAGGGCQSVFGSFGAIDIFGSEFYDNTGIGLEFVNSGASNVGTPQVVGNTIHNNSSDGLKIGHANQMVGAIVLNNNLTKNGGYGINYAGSNGDALKGLIDVNNFGTGSLANTSGAVNGFTQGPNSLTVDPTYANASTGDFTPSNAATQVGYAVGAAL